MHVEGLPFEVKGRILKESSSEGDLFSWEISHYCKPSEKAATAYYPSRDTSKSFGDAERWLFAYMRSFTGIGVEENKYY